MKKIFTLLIVLFPFFLFSQVQLLSIDATKTYPNNNNTHITHIQLSEYPVDNDFLQFVEKEVLTNALIQKFNLSKDGKTCFYESHKDITVEMIVEAINKAYNLYFRTKNHITKQSIPNNKIDSNKFRVKQDTDITALQKDPDKPNAKGKENYNQAFDKHDDTNKFLTKDECDKIFSKQNSDKLIFKEDYDKFVAKQKAGFPISRKEYNEALARKKHDK